MTVWRNWSGLSRCIPVGFSRLTVNKRGQSVIRCDRTKNTTDVIGCIRGVAFQAPDAADNISQLLLKLL